MRPDLPTPGAAAWEHGRAPPATAALVSSASGGRRVRSPLFENTPAHKHSFSEILVSGLFPDACACLPIDKDLCWYSVAVLGRRDRKPRKVRMGAHSLYLVLFPSFSGEKIFMTPFSAAI